MYLNAVIFAFIWDIFYFRIDLKFSEYAKSANLGGGGGGAYFLVVYKIVY